MHHPTTHVTEKFTMKMIGQSFNKQNGSEPISSLVTYRKEGVVECGVYNIKF